MPVTVVSETDPESVDEAYRRASTAKVVPVGSKTEKRTGSEAGALTTEEAKFEASAGPGNEPLDRPQMMVLLSNFVIDLLEMLEIPKEELSIASPAHNLKDTDNGDSEDRSSLHIEDLIQAQLKHVTTIEQPEELMVHLTRIATGIIAQRPLSENQALEPSGDEVKTQAAFMTMVFASLVRSPPARIERQSSADLDRLKSEIAVRQL